MSILLDDASTEFLNVTAVPANPPMTMACWFHSDLNNFQILMAVSDPDGGSHDSNELWAAGGDAGDPIWAYTIAGGSAGTAKSSTGYSLNTWQHACGVFAAANDRRAFINGTDKGTDPTNLTPSNLSDTYLGKTVRNGGTSYYYVSGKMAEAVIYNVALSDAEVAALGAGVSPLLVRPESIAAYWPLHNLSVVRDLIGGNHLTATGGTSDVAHAPIRMPGRSFFPAEAAAAGAGAAPTGHLYGPLIGPLGGPV